MTVETIEDRNIDLERRRSRLRKRLRGRCSCPTTLATMSHGPSGSQDMGVLSCGRSPPTRLNRLFAGQHPVAHVAHRMRSVKEVFDGFESPKADSRFRTMIQASW